MFPARDRAGGRSLGVCYEVTAINQPASIGTEIQDPRIDGPFADCDTCCAEPTGACCVDSYQCIPGLTEAECDALNGIRWLPGQDCGPPNPCPPPGAFCGTEDCQEPPLNCNPGGLFLRVLIENAVLPCCNAFPENTLNADNTITQVCPPEGTFGFFPDSTPSQLQCPDNIFFGFSFWKCADAADVATFGAIGINLQFGELYFDIAIRDTNPPGDAQVNLIYATNNPCGVGGYAFRGAYSDLGTGDVDFPCGVPSPTVRVEYA